MAEDTSTVDTDQSFSSFLKDTGMPSGAEIKKEATAKFDRYKSARDAIVKQQDTLLEQMASINKDMERIKAPSKPKFRDIEKAPEQPMRNPMQALGGVGAVIAMLGSLKTRAPLTAGLNAAAAAMQGFHKGDQELGARKQKEWESNMYAALQQNQLELQKYTTALKAADFDIAKAQAAFRTIAAENNHMSMKAALEAQDYEAQMAILDGSLKANQEAVKLFVAHKDRQSQIQATKEYKEAVLEASGGKNLRADSWRARNEFQKRVAPIDKEISGLDSADVLLRGSTPGEKIEGARVLQRLVGGSQRLKADASQMSNFGDIVTRIQGWVSKGIWGELTDDQYQQLLAGVKSLREKENARKKAVEQDMRNLTKNAGLDEGIVFGENPEDTPETPPAAATSGGVPTLEDDPLGYFLGKKKK